MHILTQRICGHSPKRSNKTMGVNTEYDESNLMNSKRRTSTVSDDPVIIEKIKDYCELTENSTQAHQKVFIFG
jgi:hypothetical protein